MQPCPQRSTVWFDCVVKSVDDCSVHSDTDRLAVSGGDVVSECTAVAQRRRSPLNYDSSTTEMTTWRIVRVVSAER